MTLPVSTNDTSEIYKASTGLLNKGRLRNSVRLLGITLSGIDQSGNQMTLFDEKERNKKKALFQAVDSLNEKFGHKTVTFAATLNEDKNKTK